MDKNKLKTLAKRTLVNINYLQTLKGFKFVAEQLWMRIEKNKLSNGFSSI